MTNENIDYERLARYLAGESTVEEKKEIESRINGDPMFAAIIDSFKNVWDAKYISTSTYDVESAWKRLSEEIDSVENLQNDGGKPLLHKKSLNLHEKSKPARTTMNWLIRVAAILMLAGLTALFVIMYLDNNAADDGQNFVQEVITEKGQRSNIHLRDGSHITLNSESKITYARDFGEDSRIVHLVGEAYFDIAHDDRPFYVIADKAVIEILGTKFNIRSYDEEDIEVVVTHGSVGVRNSDATEDQIVYLERGDLAKLPRHSMDKPIVTHDVALKRYIGWLDYRFVFEDTPMENIAKELERSYGVNIVLADPDMSKLRLTANFEGNSIHEVLLVMKLVWDLEYKIDGRKIVLSRASVM